MNGPLARLDSWKEIAAYMNRTVRTVQRWEREQGLPVRRLWHKKLGTAFAYPAELDHWLAQRTVPAAQPLDREAGPLMGTGRRRNRAGFGV